MLKSIGAFVCVRSKEVNVVRFWEGPLREAPLYVVKLQMYIDYLNNTKKSKQQNMKLNCSGISQILFPR